MRNLPYQAIAFTSVEDWNDCERWIAQAECVNVDIVGRLPGSSIGSETVCSFPVVHGVMPCMVGLFFFCRRAMEPPYSFYGRVSGIWTDLLHHNLQQLHRSLS